MLTQLLTEEVISIEAGARDWRHAIELATAPLLANGTIEPSYVAALFRSHEVLGPYYVLGPGLALPHPRGAGADRAEGGGQLRFRGQ